MDFREALRDCDLLDIGYKGYPFTWSNGRFGFCDLLVLLKKVGETNETTPKPQA